MTTPKDLLLIAETVGNRLQPSVQDLLGAAGAYTAAAEATARLLLPGTNVALAAAKFAATGGLDIFTLENPGLDLPNPTLTAALVSQVLPQLQPRHICLPHTMRGCQIAAALSVRTGWPVITGVEAIEQTGNRLLFRRAVFNGKLTAAIEVPVSGGIFTFCGSAAAPVAGPSTGRGSVTALPVTDVDCGVQPLALSRLPDDETALEEAAAIVSAGRGIGKEENLELLQAVAGILRHSALGGSRTACDAGWLPYSRQVGETGRKVAPELYLACGISGARQHLAGIKNAKTVIAVNTDPQAAIFNRADFGIVEDLTLFLPVLLEKYKARRK
jgi:electron transfer flavoprotein alpha subunit